MRFLAITVAVLLSVGCVFAQENMLVNPGFEQADAADETMPAGWGVHGGVSEQLARHLVDDALSGDRALLIIDDYASEERMSDRLASSGIVQRVESIEPGVFYRLTAWAKCLERDRENAAWLQLRFKPSDELANTHLNSPIGEWRQFTAMGQAPEGTTHAEVYIKTLHMAASRYVVDDFVLTTAAASDDDQRLALFPFGSEGIAPEQMPQPHLHTPLVTGGEPAAHIVVPNDRQWHDAGIRLRDAVEALTGAQLDIIISEGRDWTALRSPATTIAIGHLGNNFVAERMWLQRYQEVNAHHPGAGEYVLQTIPEPHDCPRGKNVLLIGASDAVGADRGVQRLLEMLGEATDDALSLDEWILEVSGVEHMDDEQREALVNRELTKFWLRDFHSAVKQYRDTGDPAWAERARFVLRRISERYLQYAHDPDVLKYWPEPTSATTHRIYWPEETSSDWLGTMWDFFEKAPVLTEEERWRGANSMLNALHDLPRHVSLYDSFARPETTWRVLHNHQTFPLIGMYYLARHFDRFYPEVDSGRISDYLQRIENGFSKQVQSWKPNEDATGYYSIVPRHTIYWSLSEGDYSFFETGQMRMYADYTVGICDNTGDAASFGDNSYGRGVYTRELDWAVWYYDDAKLQWWLDRVSRGGWANPFNPDLQSEPWEELAGITAFPLTESVYRWTGETNARGPSIMRPNVPLENAFDKIAFRESLDTNAQHFLLDGYARGTHMHYDGNAITRYFADGEDWLMDGDYLVRNTTDHTMLSVVRDGRADRVIPPCAGLEHLADLPSVGMTQTAVYGYNGLDWRRNIFWLKGGPVVLLDHCTAAEAGEYSLECIFKMIDHGDVASDGRDFSLTRRAAITRGLTVVRDPAPGVAAAVRFEGASSSLSFPLEIPAGEYFAKIIGMGLDSGTDSFFLSIDDGEPLEVHLPLEEFGRPYASGVNPKSGPMPRIEIESDGVHLVKVWLREKPGTMLDRVEFVDVGSEEVVAAIEAEDAPNAEEPIPDLPDRVFHIRNSGHSRVVESTRINHARLPIRYVHHKFGDRLGKGETLSNQAVFFNTNTVDNADWQVRRVNDRALLLLEDGRSAAVLAMGADALDLPAALATDAAMVWIGRREIVLGGATRLGDALSFAQPADLQVNLYTGEMTCSLPGTGVLGPEETTALRRAASSAIASSAATAEVRDGAAPAVAQAEGLVRAWEIEAARHDGVPQPAIEMEAHDLDADGSDETLAIRGRYLTAINADGSVRWQFDGTDELYAVGAYDITGDGRLEVFTGGKSRMLYVLDADGALLREHPIETYWRVSRTTIHEPRLDDVLVGDFDGDGEWEAALGTVDGFIQVINSDFSQRWIFGEVNHGTTELSAVDVTGDGVEEIAVGNRYGKLFVLSAEDGTIIGNRGSELGDVQMAVADLDGDGTFEMVNASATGALRVGQVGSREVLWDYPNFGYAWRDIQTADLTGDGSLEVIGCSDTGYVYAIDAAGETLAVRNLDSAVLDLAIVETEGGPMVAAGTLSGTVYLLDDGLNEVGRFPVGGRVNWVSAARTPTGNQVVAALEDGRVVALRR
ncbi:MAG: WD40 repeat domain-containing protein [Armatimonadota bacterium]|jgi:hypothetical protein